MTTDIRNLFSSSNNTALRKAMKNLGSYYGVRDQNSFVSILLKKSVDSEGKISLPSSAELDKEAKEEDTTLSVLADALISLQGDGCYGDELAEIFAAYCEGSKDDKVAKVLDTPGSEKTGEMEKCPISISLWEDQKPKGYLRKDGIMDMYGGDFKVPDVYKKSNDKDRRTISIIEIHHPYLNFSNRDSSASALFLMSLPSIQISQAVPYFDMKTIVKGSPLVEVEETKGGKTNKYQSFGNGISIYKFLVGDRVEESDEIIKHLVQFEAVGVKSQRPSTGGQAGKADTSQTDPINVSGMELFTSPQTLVDGTLQHIDLDATSKNYGSGATPVDISPNNKVLDKFRPLMTVKSFNVQVTPATGMIATKSATVALTLHDKTRMGQIMPFIVPGQLGDVEFLIEWGWSHPHSDPEINPYGALINSMRVKEKYGIMNSSYSFTPTGEVEITLKLYTKGAQKSSFELINANNDGNHPADEIRNLVTSIRAAMKELKTGHGYTLNAEMGAPDTLGKLSSTKGILSLKEEEIKAIRKFMNARKSSKSSATRKTWKGLTDQFDEAFSGDDGGKVASYQKKLQAAFKAQIDTCCKGGTDAEDDPYLPDGLRSGSVPGVKVEPVHIQRTKHVSFAKLINTFVATPLLNTERFNEVQVVYYPMNQYSMWGRSLNVGQYPINKADFEKYMNASLSRTTSLTIQQFVNFVKRYFFSFVGDDIYGLSDFYQWNSEEGKQELAEKHTKSDKAKQNFADAKHAILTKCYDGGPATFKKPNIQMFVECVGHVKNNAQTILRLHFFDRACSSYESYASMWSAASATDIGVIGKYKSAQDQWDRTPKNPPKNKKDKKKQAKWEETKKNRADRVNQYKQSAEDAENMFKTNKLVEEFTYKITDRVTNETKTKTRMRITGGPDQLRGILAANMPTLKYGTEFSGILQANLQTNSNPQMETIHMQRQGGKSGPSGAEDTGLPMQIKPVTLDLSTFGCPFINFGQQFFCDFQTNTTADDIYAVSGVSHSLTPGEFKTDIKLMPLNRLGQFRSLTETLEVAGAVASDTGDKL